VNQSGRADLSDFVGEVEAAALSNRAQLLEVILHESARLVPCDRAVCVDWDPEGSPGTTATDPEFQNFRRANCDGWLAMVPHHPKLVHWAHTGDGSAVRLSDVVSRRALHRLPIYDYFWGPFDVEYDFGVRIVFAPGRGIDLSCTRSHKDFSDEERQLLDALRPYLVRILQRADAGPLAEILRVRFGISHREAEVLALVARGKTNAEIAAALFISASTVRKHLEHVYAKLGAATRTQAARTAIEACLPGPVEEYDSLTKLLGPPEVQRAPLDAFGLTSRESQVLALLAIGKSNAQIASELSIASQTVKKHLDHVYMKLRVQRRTQAAVRALRLGRSRSEHYAA
jgi:DNA-binding CsgD family transcriptional regulator